MKKKSSKTVERFTYSLSHLCCIRVSKLNFFSQNKWIVDERFCSTEWIQTFSYTKWSHYVNEHNKGLEHAEFMDHKTKQYFFWFLQVQGKRNFASHRAYDIVVDKNNWQRVHIWLLFSWNWIDFVQILKAQYRNCVHAPFTCFICYIFIFFP